MSLCWPEKENNATILPQSQSKHLWCECYPSLLLKESPLTTSTSPPSWSLQFDLLFAHHISFPFQKNSPMFGVSLSVGTPATRMLKVESSHGYRCRQIQNGVDWTTGTPGIPIIKIQGVDWSIDRGHIVISRSPPRRSTKSWIACTAL